MWPYWMMFVVPGLAALIERPAQYSIGTPRAVPWTLDWLLVAMVTALMVGYRVQVGGDWFEYFSNLQNLKGLSLTETLELGDPGYQFLSWISLKMGWGIYGVNAVCGFIFTVGLVRFCQSLPRPWLAFTVAVPYLVIVVSMGYTRQSVALSLAMLGFLALERQVVLWFVIWVVLASVFHKTAMLLLPIAALVHSKNRYLTIVWVFVTTISAYVLLLQDSVEFLVAGYIDAEYQSEGALVRLLMNAVPAAILLMQWRRFSFFVKSQLWRWCSIISIVLVGVFFVLPSSTVVDRIGLYMLPLQMVVFSYLPDVLGSIKQRNENLVMLVVGYCALVQFVWMNFAVTAFAWLPYRIYFINF